MLLLLVLRLSCRLLILGLLSKLLLLLLRRLLILRLLTSGSRGSVVLPGDQWRVLSRHRLLLLLLILL